MAKGQRNDQTTHVSWLSLCIWHRNRNPEETQTPAAGPPAQPGRAERRAQVNRAGAGTLRASWAAGDGVGTVAAS